MLKLIRGFDKRSPVEELRLDSLSGITLMVEGSGFGAGKKEIVYGGLQPGSLAGRKRIMTSRDNAQFELKIRINGGDGPARIGQLQRDLMRFALDAENYEQAGQGEPIWLAYRLNDGLDMPEPVVGQWSSYMRVLDIDMREWAPDLTNPNPRMQSWGQSVKLTTAPFAEGAAQVAGVATGAVKVDPAWGVIVAEGRTDYNKFTNPSFGHSTYTNGWSSSGTGVFFSQETRPGFTRSYNSAVLVGAHGGSNVQWTQSIATSTNLWYVSFYARRLDGQPVTTADCNIYINGTAKTPNIIDNKDGWYRIFSRASGLGSPADFGVQIKGGHSLVVDDFQLEEWTPSGGVLTEGLSMPRPFFGGHMPGAVWDGTAHSAHTNTTAGQLTYDLVNALSGVWTIAGWFTPTGILPEAATDDFSLFSFRESSGNYVSLVYTFVNSSQMALTLYKDGSSDDHNMTLTQHEPIHLAVVQDETNVSLYVNGVLSNAVIADYEIRTTGGQLTLGWGQDVETHRSGWAMDGVRAWAYAATATEISQLYTNEKDVKAQGDIIGLPTFAWTHDAAGNVENDYDTTNNDYNHMLIGGVSGDLPAETIIEMSNIAYRAAPTIWCGRKATELNYPARPKIWNKSFTLSADQNSTYFGFEDDPAGHLRGKYSVIGLLTHKNAQTLNELDSNFALYTLTSPLADWGSQEIDEIDQADYWGFTHIALNQFEEEYMTRLGDISIGYPPGIKSIDTMVIGIMTTVLDHEVWRTDEIILMPYPNIQIRYPFGFGSYEDAPNYTDLVIASQEAYARDGAGVYGKNFYPVEAVGDGITLVPQKYNHLFFVAYDEVLNTTTLVGSDDVYNPSDNWTVTVTVTPRYTLPGGPLA